MSTKILVLMANPEGTQPLNLLSEIRQLQEAVMRAQKKDLYKVELGFPTNEQELRRQIGDYQPQILHFGGHGTPQGIVLGSERGKHKIVSNEFLVNLFKVYRDRLECIVLNACETLPLAEALSKEINYVIGMSREVKDDAAIIFSEGFYDGLGSGETIENAFELGRVAVLGMEEISDPHQQGRKIVVVDQIFKDQQGNRIENADYLIPTLKKNPNPQEIKLSNSPSDTKNNHSETQGDYMEAQRDINKVDQRNATVYGYAPNAQGSNIVSGQNVTGNDIKNVQGDNRENSPDYNFQGASFGGGFAGRDYHGDVQHNTYNAPVGIAGGQGNISVSGNAKIAGIINEYGSQKLNDIAQELTALLDYFEQNAPSIPEAVQRVNNAKENTPELNDAQVIEATIIDNATLSQRILSASMVATMETIKALLPPVGVAIEAIKAYRHP